MRQIYKIPKRSGIDTTVSWVREWEVVCSLLGVSHLMVSGRIRRNTVTQYSFGAFYAERCSSVGRKRLKELGVTIAALKKRGDYVGFYKLYTDFDWLRETGSFSNNSRRVFPVLADRTCIYNRNIDCGTWEKPVWCGRSFFAESPYALYHCLHVSETDPTQVAYYENAEKAKRDIFTRTKPGRYLTKFFSDALNESDIKLWVEMQTAALVSMNLTLKFIEKDDPDGWVDVYKTDNIASCMLGSVSVRVYAHDRSVLRLAYAVNDAGAVMGRAIVRTDDNTYIRVYPVRSSDAQPEGKWQKLHTKMQNLLEAAGYAEKGNLDGVLLDLEWDDKRQSRAVCPYLDGNAQDVEIYTKGDKEYLLVSSENTGYCANNTDGYVPLGPKGEECGCCEDRYLEDDFTYVECDDRRVCEDCLNEHYHEALVSRNRHEWCRQDDTIYCESNDTHYHSAYANDAGVCQCEVTGDWFLEDDLVMTSRGLVDRDLCMELAYDDSDGNSYAYKRDVVEDVDGDNIHTDDVITCKLSGVVAHISKMWHIGLPTGNIYIYPDKVFKFADYMDQLLVCGSPENDYLLVPLDYAGFPLQSLPDAFLHNPPTTFENLCIGENAMSLEQVMPDIVAYAAQCQLQLKAA